ncbi:UNVERIFIED_CONTAM: hypothetical protein FKN15_040914 [Acipenser sinensis]
MSAKLQAFAYGSAASNSNRSDETSTKCCKKSAGTAVPSPAPVAGTTPPATPTQRHQLGGKDSVPVPGRSYSSAAPKVDSKVFLWARYNEMKRLVHDLLPPGVCNLLNPSTIYANNEVNLHEVDIYGFDYDYTLALYSNALHSMIYDTARDFLIESFKYPEDLRKYDYVPNFAARGLHYDIQKGLLMKIDAFHYIQLGTVYRGLKPVPDDEVIELYGGTHHIPLHQVSGFYGKGPKMKQFMDIFSIPEMTLLASANDFFISNNIDYDPVHLYKDVSDAIGNVHIKGYMYKWIMQDLEKYILRGDETYAVLQRLVTQGKKLFLITNSPFSFVPFRRLDSNGDLQWDKITTLEKGQIYKEVRSQVTGHRSLTRQGRRVCAAASTCNGHTATHTDNLIWREHVGINDCVKPFRRLDSNGDLQWDKITTLEKGQIYKEGSNLDARRPRCTTVLAVFKDSLILVLSLTVWQTATRGIGLVAVAMAGHPGLVRPARPELGNLFDFLRLTGWRGSKVLYFGDHLYSDLADLMLRHGWKTGAIVPELEVETKVVNTEQYAQSLTWLQALTGLLERMQVHRDAESQKVLQDWLKEREELRAVTKNLFNPQFASIFPPCHNPTYFSRRLCRFSDLYMASLSCLLNYDLRYTFYPRRTPLQHEAPLWMDQLCTGCMKTPFLEEMAHIR